jgi:hypothetical protein
MSSSQPINPMAWTIIDCIAAFFPRSGMDLLLRYCEFALGKAECTGAFRKVFFPAAIIVEFCGKLIESGSRFLRAAWCGFGIADNCPQSGVIESFHFRLNVSDR